MIDDVLISAFKDKHDSAPRRTKVYKMRRKRIEKYLIYGLIDPISLMVRYVGLSSSGMERPKSHTQPCLRAAATHCGAWIRSLALQGLVPLNYTAETKARMREKALKRPSMSAETRAKCSAASRRRWSLVKGPYVHPAALIKD